MEQIRGATTKETWVLVAQLQRGIPAADYLLDIFLSTELNNAWATYIQRVMAKARHWILGPESPLLQLTL